MATRDISVSIAIQGEREFATALKNAQSAMKVMSSELKASEAAFNENADAQAFFANKTRIISAQIEQQQKIYTALEQAVKEAASEFGDASAKTDKYRIELNKSAESLAKLEKALRDVQQEAEEFGRDSDRIGRQLVDGIGDGAEQAADDVERAIREIRDDLDDIGGNVKLSVALDVGGSLISGIDSAREKLTGFVEEAADFNRRWGALETSTTLGGFDFGEISEQVQKAAALTGDLDGVVEGFQHLAATGFDLKEMAEASELLAAATLKFPSLDFSGLSEGLLETVKMGEATGGYLELLEKLGAGQELIDKLNESLSSTSNLESRHQAVLGYLNEWGLETHADQFTANNQDMVEYYAAQTDFTIAQAELARELTPAATAAMELATTLLERAAEATRDAKALWESYQQGEAESGQKIEELTSGESSYEDVAAKITEKIQALRAAGDELAAREITAIQQQLDTAAAEYTFGGIDEETFNAQIKALAEAAGVTLTDSVKTKLEEDSGALNEISKVLGGDVPISYGNGIAEQASYAINQAESMMSNLKSILHQEIVIPAPRFADSGSGGIKLPNVKSGLTGGDGGTVKLVAEIDGRQVAQSTAESMNSLLGDLVSRGSIYG